MKAKDLSVLTMIKINDGCRGYIIREESLVILSSGTELKVNYSDCKDYDVTEAEALRLIESGIARLFSCVDMVDVPSLACYF